MSLFHGKTSPFSAKSRQLPSTHVRRHFVRTQATQAEKFRVDSKISIGVRLSIYFGSSSMVRISNVTCHPTEPIWNV